MKPNDFGFSTQSRDQQPEVECKDGVDRSSNKLGVGGVELMVRDSLKKMGLHA